MTSRTTRSNTKQSADDDRRDNSPSPTALIVPNQRHRAGGGKSIARLRKTRQAPRRLPLRKRKSDVHTNSDKEVSYF
jgi:hypothetical protein